MNHDEIINKFIQENGYTSYLEIGVCDKKDNFNLINCPFKVGVDPDPKALASFTCTSDEFFANNFQRFDICFVDGLHHEDQVLRDIKNCMNVLTKNGVIVCHDMNPTTYEMQVVPQQQPAWTGDCWKAWVKLRSEITDWEMFVLDTDCGVGIIRRGHNSPITIKHELIYQNFIRNRKEWLNLINENTCVFKHGDGLPQG